MHSSVITDDEQKGGAAPGKNFRIENAVHAKEAGKKEGTDDADDQFKKTGEHGDKGIPQSLQGRTVEEQEIQERQTHADDLKEPGGVAENLIHHGRIVSEELEQDVFTENKDDGHDEDTGRDDDVKGFPEPFPHSGQVVGAVVLGDEGT